MLNKEQKKIIIDYLEQKCINSRFSKKTLGYLLRSFHITTPFAFLFMLFFCSKTVVSVAAIHLLFVAILYFIFDGCFLSMLEHRICGDEFTIADPFLELFNMEINHKNRIKITYYVIAIYMVCFYIIYFFKFHIFYKSSKLLPSSITGAAAFNNMPAAFNNMPAAFNNIPASTFNNMSAGLAMPFLNLPSEFTQIQEFMKKIYTNDTTIDNNNNDNNNQNDNEETTIL